MKMIEYFFGKMSKVDKVLLIIGIMSVLFLISNI